MEIDETVGGIGGQHIVCRVDKNVVDDTGTTIQIPKEAIVDVEAVGMHLRTISKTQYIQKTVKGFLFEKGFDQVHEINVPMIPQKGQVGYQEKPSIGHDEVAKTAFPEHTVKGQVFGDVKTISIPTRDYGHVHIIPPIGILINSLKVQDSSFFFWVYTGGDEHFCRIDTHQLKLFVLDVVDLCISHAHQQTFLVRSFDHFLQLLQFFLIRFVCHNYFY